VNRDTAQAIATAINKREAVLVELVKAHTDWSAVEIRYGKMADKAAYSGEWGGAHDQGLLLMELYDKREKLIADLVAADKEYQALELAEVPPTLRGVT
jgi:hypothetical protein